ncbi:MAG: ArsA family ATPase [Bacteroidetes bacterium]|nr:ArsA family ATPase [Bacteroidota bacterium]
MPGLNHGNKAGFPKTGFVKKRSCFRPAYLHLQNQPVFRLFLHQVLPAENDPGSFAGVRQQARKDQAAEITFPVHKINWMVGHSP